MWSKSITYVLSFIIKKKNYIQTVSRVEPVERKNSDDMTFQEWATIQMNNKRKVTENKKKLFFSRMNVKRIMVIIIYLNILSLETSCWIFITKNNRIQLFYQIWRKFIAYSRANRWCSIQCKDMQCSDYF